MLGLGELYCTIKSKAFEDVYTAIKDRFWGSEKKTPELEITRSKRDFAPADYSLKLESFSTVKKVDQYHSDVFEASGYKWRLHLYPNGNTESNGKGHVSLYLSIEDTADLPHNWEVNTDFKLFVFDQINNKFLTVQVAGGAVKRFHEMKTEWGFTQFLPLEVFNDAGNGYLVNDCCYFGAEVAVIKPTRNRESLRMVKKPATIGSLKWTIEGYSQLNKNTNHLSEEFTAGGVSWKLMIYPNGTAEEKGKSMSLFLALADRESFPPKKRVWTEFKLRVLDQRQGNHVEKTASHWFGPSSADNCWGFRKMIVLEDLQEASKKGFIKNGALVAQVEILTMSTTKTICS